jgi:hypothetical protein
VPKNPSGAFKAYARTINLPPSHSAMSPTEAALNLVRGAIAGKQKGVAGLLSAYRRSPPEVQVDILTWLLLRQVP